jgi:predicted nucleic acid-binding Zn ribbon protein
VITGPQIRAARELLGWTPYRLAPHASLGHTLLRQFEAGARVPDEESAARLKAALEEAGVIFTASGVKLTPRPLASLGSASSSTSGTLPMRWRACRQFLIDQSHADLSRRDDGFEGCALSQDEVFAMACKHAHSSPPPGSLWPCIQDS